MSIPRTEVILMALTKKQRERIIRQIGVLDGLTWLWTMADKDLKVMAEALDGVVGELQKVLDEDGGAEG